MRTLLAALALAGLCLIPEYANADIASRLSRYVGYTIVDVKTIEKYVDRDKGKTGDAFEGCDFGRYIVFTDGTYLRCASYDYTYEYRPEAVILVKGSNLIMIVGNDVYEMTR